MNTIYKYIIYSLKFCMFSKIKSIFADKNNPEAETKSFKHPQVHEGNASQCPFMNKNKEKENMPESKSDKKKDPKKKDSSDTESEPEEKPRGGCPFMASSGTKKNPNLRVQNDGYDEPFVSKFKYYLSANKINFQTLSKGKREAPIIRCKFDSYPIYLKHTLFYDGEDYKKVRTFQCCSRFLAYQELREKGNKYFNKGKYLKALDYYERAMSLFRWLEYYEPAPESQNNSSLMIEQGVSQSQISEEQSMSKVPLKLDNESEKSLNKQMRNKEFEQFTQKYKQFFMIYHDDNVNYFSGEEMTENVDMDMRKSLLIQIYLNMAAAYIKLNHYSLAKQVLDDAYALSDNVSQIYLRRGQIALCNRSSSIQELEEGYAQISKAVEMQPTEKIFQNTNPNILKMVNIHDAKQVYNEVKQKLQLRIQEQRNKTIELSKEMENRLIQINKIEQDMIKEGKVPREGRSAYLLSEGTDYKILLRIYSKYVRIMDFYTEAKDKQQIQLAKKQFQQILKAISEIKRIENIQIDINNENMGVDQGKIQQRLKNIKRQKCEYIYNSTRYNFHVLEWAIKQIVNQQQQMKEKQRKQEEQLRKSQGSDPVTSQKKGNWMDKLPYAMVIIPIVGIFVNYMI